MNGIKLSSTEPECFADVAPADAIRRERSFEAFQRFDRALFAEPERFEMDRENLFCAGVIQHMHGFLRRAVVLLKGPIRTDGHDGDVERSLAANEAELVRHGCVAAEHEFLAFALEDIAV